ncbi:glycine zipper family protein [Acidocella sp.]|uniref:glycine zipper family protein n=1 Tax=Acidocella sp. TaxID=50710 RepID=UPI00262B7EEF|nr:glycine zipper family protein [Acidocella sp.]
MTRKTLSLALLPLLALGACTAATPTRPQITAYPGPGKSWNEFQQDQSYCQYYAQHQIPESGQTAQQSQQNSLGTAAAGTAIGAIAGAALGSLSGNMGAGMAVGAGMGLAGGAAVAGGNAQNQANSLQHDYDQAYAQCMVGHGESVQDPSSGQIINQQPQGEYQPSPPPGY